jgi:hypothetical protein
MHTTICSSSLPNITAQPSSQSVCPNESASLSVTASGTAPLSFQWKVLNTSTGIWENVSNATASTLTINNIPSNYNSQFYCEVRSNGDDCYQATNAVTISTNPSPTLVVTNPAAVCSPSTVNLEQASITAGSTEGLLFTYWTDEFATIPYATSTEASAGTYYIKGALGNCYDIKPVTVTSKNSPKVTLTGDATVCSGSQANLTLTFTGTGPFTYSINNGEPFPAASNPEIVFDTPTETKTYNVTSLIDADCAAQAGDLGEPVTITVADNEAPVITCPAEKNINGCGTNDINLINTGIVYSTIQQNITEAQFIAAGGTFSDDCGIASLIYQDSQTGTCPIVVTRTLLLVTLLEIFLHVSS